ncbi:MAG: hypothetical protein UH824_02580 [Acutalibacteraceae bacterium]|nr:hypothetical protein [Acutalibacteraceae bacterium]
MTGKNIFDRACDLLGYNSSSVSFNDSVLIARCDSIIHAVYNDLANELKQSGVIDEILPLRNMNEPISLPQTVLNDCFLFGVAMWIAQSENDSDNQRFFARLYEYKRDFYRKNAAFAVIDDVL